MAKPPVIEDKQIEHLLKATAAYSRVPLRDTALILTLYGHGHVGHGAGLHHGWRLPYLTPDGHLLPVGPVSVSLKRNGNVELH